MNTETHIIDFFKRVMRDLSRRKKLLTRPLGYNQPLAIEIRTTYNIACEVLGSQTAGIMADDSGL